MKNSSLYIYWWILACCFSFSAHASIWDWENTSQLQCEYISRFEQCVVANKNGNARGITEFVCPQTQSSEEILDQIILDSTFKEIDEEIESFLDALSKDKEAALIDSNRVIDDITKNLSQEWVYHKRYKKLCNNGILKQRAACWKVGNIIAGERLFDGTSTSSCLALVENKLDIYSQVAYDITKVNKWDVLRDDYKQQITQVQRTRYSELVSPLMSDIVWHMWRLARWITHFTKNPLQAGILKSLISKISNLV